MSRRQWVELGALGSLAGIFAALPVYSPQGVDFFAVAFFLLGSLLIDERDIETADWTGRRPFVFLCAALILGIPFVSGAFSANGFKAQIGTSLYVTAAPPALFLVASKARFHLVRPRAIGNLILAGVFIGLIPGTIWGFIDSGAPFAPFFLPAQRWVNIASVYLSCMSAITLYLMADLDRRLRILGYIAVLVVCVLGLLTASRTFIVSEIILFGIYVLAIRRNKVLLKEIVAIVAMIIPLLAASYFIFHGSLTRLLQKQPFGFFDGRLQTWAEGWELFRRYPLFGIGPHTFYALNPLYKEWDRLGVDYIAYGSAHNIFLNTLAEGGLTVGVLLVVLIAAAINGCYVTLKNDPASRFGLIAVTLLVIFLVVGLFEDTLNRTVTFPLAIFLGLGMNVTWGKSLQVAKPD